MQEQPRVNRTAEEIGRDMEVQRKRRIVVEQFYPALCEVAESVDEAKMLVQATSSLIMGAVLETMKGRKFSEIYNDVVKKLCPDDVRLLGIEKLLGTIKGENLFVAREIIEGMTRAIDQMTMDEMKARKLDTLTADWDKMLNK